MQGEINRNGQLIGDTNTPLSVQNRKTGHK